MIGLTDVLRTAGFVADAATEELRRRLGHGPSLPWSAPEMHGAVVEIIDTSGDESGVIIPDRLIVNGTDMGWVAAESLIIEAGDRTTGPTRVTFTLLASDVRISARRH